MSVQGVAWALELLGVTPAEKALLFALGDAATPDGVLYGLPIDILSRHSGYPDSEIRGLVIALCNRGLLERDMFDEIYQLRLDVLEALI
jgi:DNA-binding IclR family transcriptional regulator